MPVRESWSAAARSRPHPPHNATNWGLSRLSYFRDEPAFCVVAARDQFGPPLRRSWIGTAACCRGSLGWAGREFGDVSILVFLRGIRSCQRCVAGTVGEGDADRRDPIRELAQGGGSP